MHGACGVCVGKTSLRWPAIAPARTEQNGATLGERSEVRVPIVEILQGQLGIWIRRSPLAQIHDNGLCKQVFEPHLVDAGRSFVEVAGRVEMRPNMLGKLPTIGVDAACGDGRDRFAPEWEGGVPHVNVGRVGAKGVTEVDDIEGVIGSYSPQGR